MVVVGMLYTARGRLLGNERERERGTSQQRRLFKGAGAWLFTWAAAVAAAAVAAVAAVPSAALITQAHWYTCLVSWQHV